MLLAACRPEAPPPAGESWLPRLAAGAFFAPGAWVDVRQRHRRAGERSARLPPVHLAAFTGGWGGAESWGGWGLGARTEVRFFLRRVAPCDLVLVCRAAELPEGRPQTVAVTVNGRELETFEVGAGWETHRVAVPDGLLRPGDNAVELAYGAHLQPVPGRDPRPLALAIEQIGLLARGERPPSSPTAAPVGVDAEADALRVTTAGTYLVPARLPPDAEALELTVRARRGARLRVAALTLDGREQRLAEGQDGRWRLGLEAYRGRDVFLLFDVEAPRGGGLELAAPRLVRGARAAAPPAPTAPPAAARPDVVLVVLDAARPDHFGVYGYGRDTTPRIDRLAAGSLTFRDALAECPYTACSMPNLLAGLSFVQHGVVERGQRLADEAETLAEALSELGYLTLGYTGNPNSSKATGSAQGFDEFHEIWRLASGRDRTHPAFLTARVAGRLEQGLGAAPLFLFAHYVPPHEPYDPDPEFDLFGDPDYDGPVTGEQRFVQSVFAREVELDHDDLGELVALYDGNLRMADHAVGRLIEALERAGRWRDTLFVLTSDHGEAFAEHGVLGHNETIHEEMVRVPLIVRLPGGERPAGVELGRLATLGDVMPTILARLGQAPPAAVRGRDLLAPAPADRAVLLRSSHEAGTIFGLRAPRWKLMARAPASWDPGWLRLFDLEEDPGETRDRGAQRRLLQAALALRLERALGGAAPFEAGETPEVPEEDQEMLRSLGYL